MLVLTRKVHERIVIGEGEDRIVVELISIHERGYVRIGISAPKEVLILREELVDPVESK